MAERNGKPFGGLIFGAKGVFSMHQRTAGAYVLEVSLFTLSSLVLYHIGIGLVFFLIPLQVVAARRGIRALLLSAGLFMLVFLALRFWPAASAGAAPRRDILALVETGAVVFALIGVVAVNLLLIRRRRTLHVLLAVAGIAGVAAIPLLLLLSRSEEYSEAMARLFAELSKALASVFAPGEGPGSAFPGSFLDPVRLREISQAVMARSLLADYFALLSFTWWAGQAAATRSLLRMGRMPFRFAEFRLEGFWLWLLIASWAFVLLDLFFGIGTLSWVGWNIGFVLLFLYGLQGMAIARFFFETRRLPRLLWLLLVAGVLILAVTPRTSLFVLVAVPGFGISENWIRYRVHRDATGGP
jgi:hypothetical protein